MDTEILYLQVSFTWCDERLFQCKLYPLYTLLWWHYPSRSAIAICGSESKARFVLLACLTGSTVARLGFSQSNKIVVSKRKTWIYILKKPIKLNYKTEFSRISSFKPIFLSETKSCLAMLLSCLARQSSPYYMEVERLGFRRSRTSCYCRACPDTEVKGVCDTTVWFMLLITPIIPTLNVLSNYFYVSL